MEIIFESRVGEVQDFFYSLWILNNYEYAQDLRADLGIEKPSIFNEAIELIKKDNNINTEKLEKYFCKEIEPNNFLILRDLWKNPRVNEYLKFIENLDSDQVKRKVIKILLRLIQENKSEDFIDELISDNNKLIKYLEESRINPKIKWEMFNIIYDSKKYIKNFIKFIEEYIETYKLVNVKRKEMMNKFNEDFEKRLREDGVEFLKEFTNNCHDFDMYDKIYVSTSANIARHIENYDAEKVCYLVTSPCLQDIIEKMSGKNDLEKNMIILKNYADEIKFKIIKLLLKKDRYGLEIGEILGISKVAVSRHMKHFVLSKLVNIRKEGQRTYYYLDKNIMESNIRFLIREFELENFKK